MAYQYIKQLAHTSNYGGARTRDKIIFLCLHYTSNDGDKAANNAKYFQTANRNASAHYFVDSNYVYQSVCDLNVAWSVGGAKYSDCAKTGGGRLYGIATNANTLNIELCDDLKNGEVKATEGTIENAIALCVELMKKYNIDLDHVIRHFDVNGKKCPSYYIDAKAWQGFKDRLAAALKNAPAEKQESAQQQTANKIYYRVTAPAGLNVRAGAGTGHKKLFALACGDRFEYLDRSGDWIRGKDNAGRTGYAYAKWLELDV